MDEIISIGSLWSFIVTCLLLIAVPGPSIMFVLAQAISLGERAAVLSVIGTAIGFYLVALVLSVGLGVLIGHSDDASFVLRLIGAIMLFVIGLSYVRGSSNGIDAGKALATRSSFKSVLGGVIVSVTNPKAYVMFGTIVPSFMSTEAARPVYALLILSMVPVLLGLMIDSAYALTAVAARAWFARSSTRIVMLTRYGGILIMIVAVILFGEAVYIFF